MLTWCWKARDGLQTGHKLNAYKLFTFTANGYFGGFTRHPRREKLTEGAHDDVDLLSLFMVALLFLH